MVLRMFIVEFRPMLTVEVAVQGDIVVPWKSMGQSGHKRATVVGKWQRTCDHDFRLEGCAFQPLDSP